MITLNVNGIPVEVACNIDGAIFAYNHCIACDGEPTMLVTDWARIFKLTKHHAASAGGYVSRKFHRGEARPYEGKYGVGVIVDLPRWDTTRYHTRVYYLY